MNNEQHLEKLHRTLIEKHLTIAIAESCTGGLIAHTLTNASGSSIYFERGIVSYSNTAKKELLGVSDDLLSTHGAVSEAVAMAMADGVRKRSHVDIGISTTGIAGPTGGTQDKPIGLVYIGMATSTKINAKKFQFHGDRLDIKSQVCQTALTLLYEQAKHL
jgi:nicotinamide-nucleotide amidase